jgi:hypothetical protein
MAELISANSELPFWDVPGWFPVTGGVESRLFHELEGERNRESGGCRVLAAWAGGTGTVHLLMLLAGGVLAGSEYSGGGCRVEPVLCGEPCDHKWRTSLPDCQTRVGQRTHTCRTCIAVITTVVIAVPTTGRT